MLSDLIKLIICPCMLRLIQNYYTASRTVSLFKSRFSFMTKLDLMHIYDLFRAERGFSWVLKALLQILVINRLVYQLYRSENIWTQWQVENVS